MNQEEYSVTAKKDGSIRYKYKTVRGYTEAMDEIEAAGLIVLDWNEEKQWMDVIQPSVLAGNINSNTTTEQINNYTNQMAKAVADEVDKEFLDIFRIIYSGVKKETALETKRLQELKIKYSEWRNWIQTPPYSMSEENIPTFDEWVKFEKV